MEKVTFAEKNLIESHAIMQDTLWDLNNLSLFKETAVF